MLSPLTIVFYGAITDGCHVIAGHRVKQSAYCSAVSPASSLGMILFSCTVQPM